MAGAMLSSLKESKQSNKEKMLQEDLKRNAVEAMKKVEAPKEELKRDMMKLKEEEAASKRLYASAFGTSGDDTPSIKLRKTKNPFKSPVSSYDSKLLAVNNPFIDVIECSITDMPADIVVDGKFIRKDVMRETIEVLLEPVIDARFQFKTVDWRAQLEAQLLHGSVLHNLKVLSLPSRDFEIKVGGRFFEHDAEGDKGEVFRDMEIHEDDEGGVFLDQDLVMKADRIGLKGKVRDTESNEQVTVLIIEFDSKGAPHGLDLYQASGYAIRAATQNILKGCFKPIYFQNWGQHVWGHGVLRPQGLSQVRDGRVVELRTIDGVVKRDEVMRAEVGGSELTDPFQILDAKLEAATKSLNDQYIFQERYPDGFYVSGTIHINSTPMQFPRFESESMVRFADALLRTFIGERVLEYSKAYVDQLVATRREHIAREKTRMKQDFSKAYGNVARLGTRAKFGEE